MFADSTPRWLGVPASPPSSASCSCFPAAARPAREPSSTCTPRSRRSPCWGWRCSACAAPGPRSARRSSPACSAPVLRRLGATRHAQGRPPRPRTAPHRGRRGRAPRARGSRSCSPRDGCASPPAPTTRRRCARSRRRRRSASSQASATWRGCGFGGTSATPCARPPSAGCSRSGVADRADLGLQHPRLVRRRPGAKPPASGASVRRSSASARPRPEQAVEISGALAVRTVADRAAVLDDAGQLATPAVRLLNYIVSPTPEYGDWTVFTASLFVPDGPEGGRDPGGARVLRRLDDGHRADRPASEEAA